MVPDLAKSFYQSHQLQAKGTQTSTSGLQRAQQLLPPGSEMGIGTGNLPWAWKCQK